MAGHPDRVAPKRALLSVSDKTGLVEFARALADRGVELLTTGGSKRLLSEAGIPVIEVADFTGFPEIMDGRVKTLHPSVHGGLLAIRDDAEHVEAMEAHGIGAFLTREDPVFTSLPGLVLYVSLAVAGVGLLLGMA